MGTNRATDACATLGRPGRLVVFRLRMRFAPRGVRPTGIAEALGLKQNTLSHYLADLAGAGLVAVARQGRSLFYAADLEAAEGLIGYLALDVGRGRPDLLSPLAHAHREPSAKPATVLTVLFICSGNAARSIFA